MAARIDPNPHGEERRQRLHGLLAIPEHERSEAVWAEIVELEIQLAPVNRAGHADCERRDGHREPTTPPPQARSLRRRRRWP